MLTKLTRFELKKMAGNKFFFVALAVLMAACVLLNCGYRQYIEQKEELESWGVDFGEDYEYPSFLKSCEDNRKSVEMRRRNYAPFLNRTDAELEAFAADMMEKYGLEVLDFDSLIALGDRALEETGYWGTDCTDSDLILSFALLDGRDDVLAGSMEKVIQAAQAFGREALEDGDNYGIRRNLQIIKLYEIPRGDIRSDVRGWNSFAMENNTILFVGLMLLLACAGSVSGEQDRLTWLLLHTAKNGKGKTLAAKYLAGILLSALLTVLFQGVLVGCIWFHTGFMGLTQPVAAVDELALVPYTWTVWQYLLVCLACNLVAAALISTVLTTVSALSKNSILSYGAGALVLGGCLWLAFNPPRNEWLSGPLAISQTTRFFDSYYTANLFGFPVLWVLTLAVLWTVLCILAALVAHRITHRKRGAV